MIKSAAAWTFIGAILLATNFASAQTPYDLNVMEPLTGSGAFLGREQKTALQSLSNSVNQNGGIGGRPVNLIFHDDQTNPQTAVQLLNDVLTTHPPVVLGSALVAMCNAMAPIVRDGPLLYCLSPGHSPVPGTYDLASGAPVEDTVQALFRFFRLKGWTRLALITSSDASGQEADRAIGAVLALPENKSLDLFAAERDRPDGALDRIVVELDATIVDKAAEGGPARECIEDRWCRQADAGASYQHRTKVPSSVASPAIYAERRRPSSLQTPESGGFTPLNRLISWAGPLACDLRRLVLKGVGMHCHDRGTLHGLIDFHWRID